MLAQTDELWLLNVLINEPSRDLHSFRVLSSEPDNMVAPSGEKQQTICVPSNNKVKDCNR